MSKSLVIGLDGVPLGLIQKWSEAGELPVLSRFFKYGASGPLRSTMPPTSAAAWSSFVTGKNPGQTGVYDFLYREQGSYNFSPANGRRRDGQSLWHILSTAGKRVGVVNVPLSYPAEPVNGWIISDRAARGRHLLWTDWDGSAALTSPEELPPDLDARALAAAIEPAIAVEATLTATYER